MTMPTRAALVEHPRDLDRAGSGSLWAAVAATLLASGCCLGPLVLVFIGITGSWMARLAALAPLQPLFLVLAVAAMVLAGRRLWRRGGCEDASLCARPQVLRVYRIVYLLTLALLLLNFSMPWIAPWFYG